MISDNEKQTIFALAEKFGVKELILFGSSLGKEPGANDIDLAVRGISSEDFFDFRGKLLRYLVQARRFSQSGVSVAIYTA